MKKRIVSVILVCVLLLGLGGVALATSGSVNRMLEYANITISLNGKNVELKDADGNAVEPFIINGSTYVPVRAVASALGLYVDWDQKNTNVILNETPVRTGEDAEELTIYLVRHGKTLFNTTSQFQGFCDSPLTEVGIEQAVQVGKNMADIQFTTAYSSDLGRQRSTLNLMLAQNNSPIPTPGELYGLREWNYGSFEGRDESLCAPMVEKYGYTLDQWSEFVSFMGNKGLANAYADFDPEGLAENYEQISTRAKEAIDTIVKESVARGGGNVLVVSSGSQLSVLLELMVPDEFKSEYIANCAVSIVKYSNGKFTLEVVNDTSYRDGK